MVTVENLTKSYNDGKVKAITDLTFRVNEGEVFGLIGPDGAGKTTLFRILTTLLLPDSGNAQVAGFDIQKQYKNIRESVGYMPGKFSLYQDLTVEENLSFFATVFGTTIEQNYALIKDIYSQIEPFRKRKAGQLSGGMKQKLALSCALIHRPKVLFLDEPTTGVDAVSRKEFWEMLRRLKSQGITILVSTPYMDEASLCDRIALIQNGTILSINTPQAVTSAFGEKLFGIKSEMMYTLQQDLRSSSVVKSCNAFGEFYHLTLKDTSDDASSALLRSLKEKGHQSLEFEEITPKIEDCFIKLMSEGSN